MSELNPYEEGLALDLKAALDRIEELEERLKAAQDDAKEAEAYAEDMEAKLAKAEAAIYRIAPYLSASLSELDCGLDYIAACNQVFEADSIIIAELKGESQ